METRRQWEKMRLSRVGNVADVMQKKSGAHFDPSAQHTIKNGLGPP